MPKPSDALAHFPVFGARSPSAAGGVRPIAQTCFRERFRHSSQKNLLNVRIDDAFEVLCDAIDLNHVAAARREGYYFGAP